MAKAEDILRALESGEMGMEDVLQKYPSSAVSNVVLALGRAADLAPTGPKRLCWEMVQAAVRDVVLWDGETKGRHDYLTAWRLLLAGNESPMRWILDGIDLDPGYIKRVLEDVDCRPPVTISAAQASS